MALQKLTNAIKWFFKKIDFVARKPATGESLIASLKTIRWYWILLMFVTDLRILYVTFTTQKTGRYEMRLVAIVLLTILLLSISLKLFGKKHIKA